MHGKEYYEQDERRVVQLIETPTCGVNYVIERGPQTTPEPARS